MNCQAEQGDMYAQYNLAAMYSTGAVHGVPQDSALALRWFRCAADQGDARAKHALGKSTCLLPTPFVVGVVGMVGAAAYWHIYLLRCCVPTTAAWFSEGNPCRTWCAHSGS